MVVEMSVIVLMRQVLSRRSRRDARRLSTLAEALVLALAPND